MRAPIAALLLVACGSPASPPPSAPIEPLPAPASTALFPERPELDAIAPARPYVFKQETWTEISAGAQHCREWAFPARDEPALREDAYGTLRALGLSPTDGYFRQDGIAFSLGAAGSDASAAGVELVKLVACTERADTVPAMRAYLARTSDAARASQAARAITLDADAAWERELANGLRQIGVRVRGIDAATARPRLERAGFTSTPGTLGAIDLALGSERVRFIGDRVWWQGGAPR